MKNGQAVDFSYLVQEGDFFSVYPCFYNFNLPDNYTLQDEYQGKPAFVLDVHLGKLARFLRRFNFDTAYRNDYSDKEIVDIAEAEDRIILTRDLGVLMRKRVKWGTFIKDDDPKEQLKQVFLRYDLDSYYQGEGSRCVDCNTELVDVDKSEIIERLEPKTKKFYDKFKICPNCGKIYWKGSHYHEAEDLLKKFINSEGE